MTVVINGTTGIDTVQDGIITNAKIATMAATKLTGQVPDANAPSGSVIQVVNFTTNSYAFNTGATFTDTGLSASITPQFATSKILVIVDLAGCGKDTNNGALALKLVRNSTDLYNFEGLGGYTASTASNFIGSVSTNYLDSPNTTAATTYKVQLANIGGSTAAYVSIGNYYSASFRSVSTITLMEVAQ